jgi:hypothetical protein
VNRQDWVNQFVSELIQCDEEELERLVERIIDYGYMLAVADGAGDSTGR